MKTSAKSKKRPCGIAGWNIICPIFNGSNVTSWNQSHVTFKIFVSHSTFPCDILLYRISTPVNYLSIFAFWCLVCKCRRRICNLILSLSLYIWMDITHMKKDINWHIFEKYFSGLTKIFTTSCQVWKHQQKSSLLLKKVSRDNSEI